MRLCSVEGCGLDARVRGWCRPHYYRAWVSENREHVREYSRDRYEDFPERKLAEQRRRKARDPVAYRAKYAAHMRAWRAKNRERSRQSDRRWRRAHPARAAAIQKKSRQKGVESLTPSYVRAILRSAGLLVRGRADETEWIEAWRERVKLKRSTRTKGRK